MFFECILTVANLKEVVKLYVDNIYSYHPMKYCVPSLGLIKTLVTYLIKDKFQLVSC